MNKNEIYEKNLKGLENFKNLSLEERIKRLKQIGIIDENNKLSKNYGGT
jgi:hypothetical protein